jgi:hypothetical protein
LLRHIIDLRLRETRLRDFIRLGFLGSPAYVAPPSAAIVWAGSDEPFEEHSEAIHFSNFGITNGRVFRSADHANDVVILHDVADVSKARTWLDSKEMKSMMEKSGVIGSPSIRFAAAA